MNLPLPRVHHVLRLNSTKAMMTDPDQHTCRTHPREQQSLVPDTSTTSAGHSLETAACALLRARPRRTGLPSTAGSSVPARR
jgi:hypothetical protein